jgi:dienelactone hydrolase
MNLPGATPRKDQHRPNRATNFRVFAATAILAAAIFAGPPAGAASGGPTAGGAAQVRTLLIPMPAAGVSMQAEFYRPAGPGPFRLAVINHSSEQDPDRRALMPPPSYPGVTEWFLARGYAVLLPERPGHGRTGGPYIEDQGPCENADFVAAGKGAADSIAAAIAYITTDKSVRRDGIVVVGNSAGGWGALALAARNPRGVKAIVNFSGGRGGHDRNRPLRNCSPERLVAAAAVFGRTARVPTLWLYAANDTYFPPELSGGMADAFRKAGGAVEYHLLPAIPGEGHALIQAPASAPTWRPFLASFLGSR